MKTYVLTVSRYFPTTHKRKGEETFFIDRILAGQTIYSNMWKKIHTIRANYELWAKRIKDVKEGKAILSIRYWSGKPYNSKQVEVCQLDKNSGCGVQKVTFEDELKWGYIEIHPELAKMKPIPIFEDGRISGIAKNDGLSLEDFKEWFKNYDLKPMAIIHFTHFRF